MKRKTWPSADEIVQCIFQRGRHPQLDDIALAIERGRHPHLDDIAALARSGMKLSPTVRDYIANLIQGKVKRPRGRVLSLRERFTVHQRRMRLFYAYVEAMSLARDRLSGGNRRPRLTASDITIAAKNHNVTAAALRNFISVEIYKRRGNMPKPPTDAEHDAAVAAIAAVEAKRNNKFK